MTEFQKGFRVALQSFRADRYQEQRQTLPTPMALKQMQFIDHGVRQLQRVIGQVAVALLQNRGGVGQGDASPAVEPSGLLRFKALSGLTAEPELGVASQYAEIVTQLGGGPHRDVAAVIHRQPRCHQRLQRRWRFGGHGDQHRLGSKPGG